MSRIVRPNTGTVLEVDYTPFVSPARPTPENPRSRLSTRKAILPIELVIPEYPYEDWAEPPVWVDSTVYPADFLEQQITTNVMQVVHPILTVTESFTVHCESPGVFVGMPLLELPILANETWYFKWIFIAVSQFDNWSFGVQVPPESVVGAEWNFRRDADATSNQDAWLRYGGAPLDHWSNWNQGVWAEGTNSKTMYAIELAVTAAANGTVLPMYQCNQASDCTIWIGTTILGMQLQ